MKVTLIYNDPFFGNEVRIKFELQDEDYNSQTVQSYKDYYTQVPAYKDLTFVKAECEVNKWIIT